MEIVEFPRDVVDPTEDIQLPIVIIDAMAIPYSRQLSILLHSHKPEVSQAETP